MSQKSFKLVFTDIPSRSNIRVNFSGMLILTVMNIAIDLLVYHIIMDLSRLHVAVSVVTFLLQYSKIFSSQSYS